MVKGGAVKGSFVGNNPVDLKMQRSKSRSIRQKRDILVEDTALLEREYALEKGDFQRAESIPQRVVVYGGNGFFGRIIVDELLRRTTARIDIASRTAHSVEYPGYDYRVRFVESDLHNQDSVLRTVAGADLIIVAAGPFQGMPLTVLQACIDERLPYIDVAEDRTSCAVHTRSSNRTGRRTECLH
jgi:hypothetical protein